MKELALGVDLALLRFRKMGSKSAQKTASGSTESEAVGIEALGRTDYRGLTTNIMLI